MKKIFYISLIAVFVCAFGALVLPSCAKKNGAGQNGRGGGNAGGKNAGGQNGGAVSQGGEGGIPVLTWWLVGPQPDGLNTVIKQLSDYTEKKIGARFEVKLAGWGNAPQRFQTIVNSGESFDLMYIDAVLYNQFAVLGAFAPLDDLIPRFAPALLDVVPPVLWEGVKIKGAVYSVPSYKDSSKTIYQIWDAAIVDKYNIDISKTAFADLDAPFHTIKAGEGRRYYPFRMAKGTNNFIFDEYDALSSGVEPLGVKLDDAALRVVCTLEQPDIKEKYYYLHRWYKDGIINPDAFLIDESPKQKPFMMAQGWPSAAAGWAVGEGVTKYVVSRYIGPLYTTDSIQGAMNAVSINSRNKEKALKFLELINTDRVFRDMLAWGIEGRHFEYVRPGIIRQLNSDWQMAAFEQGQFFNMSTTEEQANAWAEVLELNNMASVSPLLGFALDITNIRTEVANAKTIWNKFKISLMTGAADPDVEIPRCLAELRKNGMDKIIAEAQRQVDGFAASRGAAAAGAAAAVPAGQN